VNRLILHRYLSGLAKFIGVEKYKKYMITDKQRRYIIFLCNKLNRDIPENLDLMSKREASRLIDELLKSRR